jgi:hypothetical protein
MGHLTGNDGNGKSNAMVSGRGLSIVALALFSACGGEAIDHRSKGGAGSAGAAQAGSGGAGAEAGMSDATGGTAGSAGAPTSGGAGSGGSAGTLSAGSGGAGSDAAGSAGAGFGGAAGGAGPPEIPGATDEEREILAPLGTDDAALQATSGAELIALIQEIAFARGYAMCRCTWTPEMPPADPDETLGCAREEGRFLASPDQARCVGEGSANVPSLDAELRCQGTWLRDDGIAWVNTCFGTPWMPAPDTCTTSPEYRMLLDECQFVTYCANDERVGGSRCDQKMQCQDQSDELGCFEVLGRDWFWCDPELLHPMDVCSFDLACGLAKEPPVCDPMRPGIYLCDDGGEVTTALVCNRAVDCEDGSDERYCVK